MKPRYLKTLVTLVAVAGYAGFACFLLFPWPGINKGNFDKIEIGFTKNQVERLLGGPARSEVTADARTAYIIIEVVLEPGQMLKEDEPKMKFWTEQDGVIHPIYWKNNYNTISVYFSKEERVLHKVHVAIYRWYNGPMDKLRRWLKL